jgi:hypothetical protein
MAKWIVDNDYAGTVLDKLDFQTQRRIRRKMVENASKVLIKEMQATTEARHHVVHSWMKDSIAAGKVYEDVDGTSIDVYPQGNDPRGVNNEMKMKMINYGYYNVDTGQRIKKKDYFLNEKFRKKCAPHIRGVMNYTLQLCMEELNR